MQVRAFIGMPIDVFVRRKVGTERMPPGIDTADADAEVRSR